MKSYYWVKVSSLLSPDFFGGNYVQVQVAVENKNTLESKSIQKFFSDAMCIEKLHLGVRKGRLLLI